MSTPVVWTPAAIDAECKAAHGRYERRLKEHYVQYFSHRPEERGGQSWSARDLRVALPAGLEELELLLAVSARHRQHLSAGSSQVVGLALIGAACMTQRDLAWYGALLDLPIPSGVQQPRMQVEFALESVLLGERPNFPTTIDFLASDDGVFVCAEAKYWEKGLGRCGCHTSAKKRNGTRTPDPAETAECSSDIRARDRYWDSARDILGLPGWVAAVPCPIAAGYQGIRNVAAARELARGRSAAFVLFFDERNPYFAPTGSWVGWPAYLRERFEAGNGEVEFRSCSWQRLLGSGAVPDSVVEWARVKHGLVPAPSSDVDG